MTWNASSLFIVYVVIEGISAHYCHVLVTSGDWWIPRPHWRTETTATSIVQAFLVLGRADVTETWHSRLFATFLHEADLVYKLY